MQRESHQSLESLAEQDPVTRPLALLQLAALDSAADPVWARLTEHTKVTGPNGSTPALSGKEIAVDSRRLTGLLSILADTLLRSGVELSPEARSSVNRLDPLRLVEASIEWDETALQQIADEAGLEPAVVATLGQYLSMPMLVALGERLAEGYSDPQWDAGYCPVCGSWALLAEQRGLEKQLWLRCGRCSANWRTRQLRCVYCDNTDHRRLGYLAAEDERESRRVVTCQECSGYLKVLSTVAPFAFADLLRHDLESLELDVAAIDEGFNRPDQPGYPIQVDVIEAPGPMGGWRLWR